MAISLGSKVSDPIATQSRPPLIVRPIDGASGSSSAASPSNKTVYRYRSKMRTSFTTINVSTNTPIPIATHSDCTCAR